MKKNLLFLFCLVFAINKIHSQTNWELLNPKPTASTGKDIDFISDNVGYIITNSELLETLDSGISWHKKQDISSGNDICFYNNTGIIVGNDGYVLKSTDNGATWSRVLTGLNTSFNAVSIADQNTIILSNHNSIVKSTDGGTTWQSLSVPNVTIKKTFFVNPLVGHATCMEGKILKTVDGGQNWYVGLNTNAIPSSFLTLYFFNENIGFASQEHSSILYKTIDGGETWSQVSGLNDSIYAIHFSDANNGFISGDHGATFKTSDGGISWSRIFFQNGYVDNTTMHGIHFRNSTTGYATGARGRIIKTTDGGQTWTHNSPTYNDFHQLEFFNATSAYAQTRDKFYKTTDSGDNWALVSSLNLFDHVIAGKSTFVNENLGYATTTGSNGGTVYKTTDGGVTWNVLNNGWEVIDEGINSIFFLDADNGFVSGGYNSRRVMKTTNGGASWSQVGSMSFAQMQFVTPQIGFAFTDMYNPGGKLYKTADGGNTWSINFEVDHNINSLHFLDATTGFFVGDNGVMYKTADGGVSWQKVLTPELFEEYELVQFYSKNVGYIADDEGKLYKTMNGGESWEFLTTQYIINSIKLNNNKIFNVGTNGKIYRSDVEYDPVVLYVNQAKNISNSSATIMGNATSNQGTVSNIHFEYSTDSTFMTNTVATSSNLIVANESLNFSSNPVNLNPNTVYFFRLVGTYNSTNYTSNVLIFKTLPDYEITTYPGYSYTATTTEISGNIISNEHNITNIEFQYGTSADALNTTVNGNPLTVLGHTSSGITSTLTGLEPGTQYFFRLKATHQGQDIYGDIQSFTTRPDYTINLYNPVINGNDITLSAYVTSYNKEITNIVFEYGTLRYENNIGTSPSMVNAQNSAFVNATLTNLDPNRTYYYKVRAIHDGETIYSQERIFNISGNMIIVSGTIEEIETGTLKLKGLINCNGNYLTDIKFEYGTTPTFGSYVMGTPSIANGYNTNVITALVDDFPENQIIYYRISAINNGNTVYSDTYQYSGRTSSSLLKAYPNPTSDIVTITLKNKKKISSIELFSQTGKLIYHEEKQNASDTARINVSHLNTGIYIVKVNTENSEAQFKRLIIN